MRARVQSLWRALTRRTEFEQEMDEEVRFHLEARAADLVRRGLSMSEAARRARLEFGGGERYMEECREARGLRFFDESRGDVRYAWRSLKGSPGASAVAIVILGLAIGANVGLFTFIDAYAVSALPIASADRYVDLVEANGQGGRSSRWTREEVAALEVATAPAFEGLFASSFFELPLLEPTQRMVHGQAVSPRFFTLLGARLAMGRAFGPDEDRASSEVAVLSDVGWKGLLQGDASALGRRIRLANTWVTVVGVTVPEFHGVEPIVPELWIPPALHAALTGGPGETPRYDLAGLLRPGMTPEGASGVGSGIVAGFERPADREAGRRRLLVEPRPSFLHADERGQLSIVGGLLLGAFSLVLLIACANLASLHIARASARHREIATRLALGATRVRLVRQLMTESLLLAAIGAAVGCALALGGAGWIQSRLFSIVTAAGLTLAPLPLHGRVLAFAAFLGVLAALAFGLLPALEATSPDLYSGARRDGLVLGGRTRRQRVGGVLVSAQVAASLVLLVLAGLLLRNAQAANRLGAGYDAGRLIALGYPHPTVSTVENLRRDAQVANASAVEHIPLSGSMPRHPMTADGVTRTLRYNHVDDAYFETLGLRLVEGRGFRPEEARGAAPVVVVSATTARTLWPGGSPLGRVVEVTEAGGPARGRYEVIGVAPDVVSGFFFQGRDPSAVYFAASGSPRASEILVRPRGDTGAAVEGLRASCQAIDRAVLCEPKTLQELAAVQRFMSLVPSVIASALGSLALALTLIGLYGIVPFTVVQRVRKVGVRIALGATPGQVVRLLVGRAARSVVLGLAVGLPICLLLSRVAARFFRLLDAFDPVTLLGVPVLLATVALIAALVPARRATAVDPVVSLRAE